MASPLSNEELQRRRPKATGRRPRAGGRGSTSGAAAADAPPVDPASGEAVDEDLLDRPDDADIDDDAVASASVDEDAAAIAVRPSNEQRRR